MLVFGVEFDYMQAGYAISEFLGNLTLVGREQEYERIRIITYEISGEKFVCQSYYQKFAHLNIRGFLIKFVSVFPCHTY